MQTREQKIFNLKHFCCWPFSLPPSPPHWLAKGVLFTCRNRMYSPLMCQWCALNPQAKKAKDMSHSANLMVWRNWCFFVQLQSILWLKLKESMNQTVLHVLLVLSDVSTAMVIYWHIDNSVVQIMFNGHGLIRKWQYKLQPLGFVFNPAVTVSPANRDQIYQARSVFLGWDQQTD